MRMRVLGRCCKTVEQFTVDCEIQDYSCDVFKTSIQKLFVHISFYRAMHFSAYARSWDRMSSVRLSVCL